MKKNAYLVVEVSNLKNENKFTPLAFDIASILQKIFEMQQDIVIIWEKNEQNNSNDSYGYGQDHSFALLFKNT